MRTALYVLLFAGLMLLLTAPARADDAPQRDDLPPPAVYVPPVIVQTVQRHDAEIADLRTAQRQQADVNAAVLAELKALRGELAAMKTPKVEAKIDVKPIGVKQTNPACGCVPGLGCPQCDGSGKCAVCRAAGPPAKPATTVMSPAVRAPVGHTHTCPRCGTTWDHASNPGHNCPTCGTAQYVQDRTPRYIYTSPAPLQQATGCANGACAAAGYSAPAVTYSTGGVYLGGCANGSCGSGRTGWYPGKWLGR